MKNGLSLSIAAAVSAVAALVGASTSACSRDVQAVTPQELQQRYGLRTRTQGR